MCFKLSIGQNVINLLAQANQFTGDQNGSMAVQRVLFRAHQRNVHALTSVQYTLDSGLKQRCLGQFPKSNAPILIAGWIGTSGSKFFAEIHVRQSTCSQRLLQRFPIELRMPTTVGHRPHIRHCPYVMPREQVDKLRHCMRRVAYRKDSGGVRCSCCHCFSKTAATNFWQKPS